MNCLKMKAQMDGNIKFRLRETGSQVHAYDS